MRLSKSTFIQILFSLIFIIILGVLVNNIIVNLINTKLGFSFNWLERPAGFALSEHALSYSPSDSYAWALFIGWLNSLKVIILSLFLATFIGFSIGLARISKNLFLRSLASLYVSLVRQIPLLLQLMFWYFVVFLGMKNDISLSLSRLFSFSNKGIYILNLHFSSEFSALLFGLSIFTGAYIAEVVRGGINSVKLGQWEAFRSLGLSEISGLFKVIVPQSLPAILPGLTSQYLNLAKNSTLAIAIGYADIYAISDTVINQTGRAVEGFLLLLLSFLVINLLISNIMEFFNNLVIK